MLCGIFSPKKYIVFVDKNAKESILLAEREEEEMK